MKAFLSSTSDALACSATQGHQENGSSAQTQPWAHEFSQREQAAGCCRVASEVSTSAQTLIFQRSHPDFPPWLSINNSLENY